MRVFRVGHREKTFTIADKPFPIGPYNRDDYNADLNTDMIRAHGGWGSHKHHPTPAADPYLNGVYSWEVCGFSSLGALLDWFETFLQTLDRNGYALWVYDVPDEDVRVGMRCGQLVFEPESAVKVSMSRLPLDPEQLALFDAEGTSSPDQG
ncbi:hypothetical protein [Streptomyces cylindrosporus]|uniref:Uncharacterized protein n=1 Tax=Streptomyces cylindrosporus TaxID=2927583 RepID=A0ABS9Y1E9_9ACTN|nr:hypothetical protein [Streptomyces cylindrosporus]MCI3271039.1 hypothetical protein [Streptomyces cylindrosporus]